MDPFATTTIANFIADTGSFITETDIGEKMIYVGGLCFTAFLAVKIWQLLQKILTK